MIVAQGQELNHYQTVMDLESLQAEHQLAHVEKQIEEYNIQ